MCGISAAIAFKPLAIKYLLDMNNQIVHRGPDDGGLVFFNNDKPQIFG